jgi:hypothetical protein
VHAAQWSVTDHWGLEGLARVEPDWRRLYEEMPNPAMWDSYEAYRTYVKHLCPQPDRFRCVALSDGEAIRAIFPLEERWERALGVPFRVWGLPYSKTWRPTDVIGPEGDARRALLPAVVGFLRQQPNRPALLAVGPTLLESDLWDGIDQFAPSERCVFGDGAEYVVPCDRPFEEFERGLSGNTLASLRKAERRFSALPEARCVRASSPTDLAREFERFLDVEASGWKGAAGSAIKFHPQRVAFYRELLTAMARDGRCEIRALYTGERCIATEFCVFTRRQCAALKGGYDEEFARVSPGRLLTHKSIQWCCEDPGVDSESEVSDAPWLRIWNPNSNELRRAYVTLRPSSGRLLALLMRFRFGPARRLVRGFKARRSAAKTRS